MGTKMIDTEQFKEALLNAEISYHRSRDAFNALQYLKHSFVFDEEKAMPDGVDTVKEQRIKASLCKISNMAGMICSYERDIQDEDDDLRKLGLYKNLVRGLTHLVYELSEKLSEGYVIVDGVVYAATPEILERVKLNQISFHETIERKYLHPTMKKQVVQRTRHEHVEKLISLIEDFDIEAVEHAGNALVDLCAIRDMINDLRKSDATLYYHGNGKLEQYMGNILDAFANKAIEQMHPEKRTIIHTPQEEEEFKWKTTLNLSILRCILLTDYSDEAHKKDVNIKQSILASYERESGKETTQND
jgi:hypothetical protein